MNSLERARKRRKLKNSTTIYKNADEALVQKFLNSDVDDEKVNSVYERSAKFYDISVTDEEATEFIEKFKKDFNDKKFSELISTCKNDVITSIVTPFGLGKIVSAYDKVGGNVDTIYNVREDIYATENEKKSYLSRDEYDTHKYHSHKGYRDINKTTSELKNNDELIDYTTNNKIERNSKHDLDHVISAKEIADDRGRVLSGLDGADLANKESNLKATDSTINRSKKADSMSDFIKRKNKNLKELEALEKQDNLSTQEIHRLEKLKKLDKIDDEKALAHDKEAREKYDKEINSRYYSSKKFLKNTATTSLTEAGKMSIQQTLGLIMVEFFTAVFEEITDIYKNGFDNEKFFEILGKRLKKIAIRIKEQWKNVVTVFKDGFLAGFISNLVTTVINAFVTTGKRVVRIIREGLFSLIKAIKILLFPPKDMSYTEAMQEAKKLIASGLIISLGVIAEEYISKLIASTGALSAYSDILTAVFVGAITGLAVTMTVYYLDKKKNDKEIVNALILNTEEKVIRIEKLLIGSPH